MRDHIDCAGVACHRAPPFPFHGTTTVDSINCKVEVLSTPTAVYRDGESCRSMYDTPKQLDFYAKRMEM